MKRQILHSKWAHFIASNELETGCVYEIRKAQIIKMYSNVFFSLITQGLKLTMLIFFYLG